MSVLAPRRVTCVILSCSLGIEGLIVVVVEGHHLHTPYCVTAFPAGNVAAVGCVDPAPPHAVPEAGILRDAVVVGQTSLGGASMGGMRGHGVA